MSNKVARRKRGKGKKKERKLPTHMSSHQNGTSTPTLIYYGQITQYNQQLTT